jgi:hypothetical protein
MLRNMGLRPTSLRIFPRGRADLRVVREAGLPQCDKMRRATATPLGAFPQEIDLFRRPEDGFSCGMTLAEKAMLASLQS